MRTYIWCKGYQAWLVKQDEWDQLLLGALFERPCAKCKQKAY